MLPCKYVSSRSASSSHDKPEFCRKYLVFHTKLMELFRSCPVCKEDTDCTVTENGTAIRVCQDCKFCNHHTEWNSQPYVGQMAAGNLMLSAAILFSGCMVAKVLRFLDILDMAAISASTFFRHQSHYLQPTIITYWQHQQRHLRDVLRLEPTGLVLAGDCRSDSPGHCAKYGSYSVIEQRVNKVIDVQMVQVSYVHQ